MPGGTTVVPLLMNLLAHALSTVGMVLDVAAMWLWLVAGCANDDYPNNVLVNEARASARAVRHLGPSEPGLRNAAFASRVDCRNQIVKTHGRLLNFRSMAPNVCLQYFEANSCK